MGGGKIKHQHFHLHGIITKTAQRYKKIFNYATRTRIFLRIVTKNLRIVTLLSPKRQIFHICVKIDTRKKFGYNKNLKDRVGIRYSL